MGLIPGEAHAPMFFQSLDQQMGTSMRRIGAEFQALGSSWQGDAHEYFKHVVMDWHLAYDGLFGNAYTHRPGVVGEIARQMGVQWCDHATPVTNSCGGPVAPMVSGQRFRASSGGLVAMRRAEGQRIGVLAPLTPPAHQVST